MSPTGSTRLSSPPESLAKNLCPAKRWSVSLLRLMSTEERNSEIARNVTRLSARVERQASRRDAMCNEITEADLDRAGLPVRRRDFGALVGAGAIASMRSEEHTSELQSLMRISYAVFCLKKKKNLEPPVINPPPTTSPLNNT